MSHVRLLVGLCFIVSVFVCLVTLTLDRSKRVVSLERAPSSTFSSQNYINKSFILLWTPFFSSPDYLPTTQEKNCAFQDCVVTSNRSVLNQSRAIVFHALDISLTDLPAYRSPDQEWILFVLESPFNTGTFRNYDGLFNLTATYRLDSDIWTPYAHVMKRLDVHSVQKRRNYWLGKSDLVSWFNSNCNTVGGRENFVKELEKYVKVDIYGSCGTLSCAPKMSFECYERAAVKYFFYLSFENSICKDYVTEKFYHILKFDMVPVVFGGGNYSVIAPPGSYIDALSFESPKALADHLKTVAENATLYNSYFAWRETYALGGYHWVCEMCKRLSTTPDTSTGARVYKDLDKWWRKDAQCLAWTPTGLKPV